MQTVTTDGSAIRRLRVEQGLSLRELASACDIDETQLSRVETGRRERLTLEQQFRVARRLNVQVEAITTVTDAGPAHGSGEKESA